MNQIMSSGIIGSLLYETTRRPDIVFIARIFALFQACSRESHLKAAKRAKRILRYLRKTNVSWFHGTFNDFFLNFNVCLGPFCSNFNVFLSVFCRKVVQNRNAEGCA